MWKILVSTLILVTLLLLGFDVVAGRSNLGLSNSTGHPPSGTSPADALPITCSWERLAASSQLWYKIPPRDPKRLVIQVESHSRLLDRLEFLVYAAGADRILMGPLSHSDKRTSQVVLAWTDGAGDGVSYYLNIVNSNPFEVSYTFCTPYL